MLSKLKPTHRRIVSQLINYSSAFFSVFEGKNYYQILEIKESASPDQIKQSFLRLAKIYHPDAQRAKSQSSSDSDEAFKKLLEAYNTLSDKKKREDYDSGLKGKQSTGENTQQRGPFKTSYKGFYRTAKNDDSDTQYQQTYSSGNNQQDWQQDPYSERRRAYSQQEKADELSFLRLEWVFFGGLLVLLYWRINSFSNERQRIARRGEVTDEDIDKEDEEALYYATRPDQHVRGDKFYNLRKKSSKNLTPEDCKAMTIEQLVDMHKLGYTLPSPYKERVLEYEHVYEDLPRIAHETKVERMRKRASQYNNQEETKKSETATYTFQTKSPEQKETNTNVQESATEKNQTVLSKEEEKNQKSVSKSESATSSKKKSNLKINEILNPIREIAKSDLFENGNNKSQKQEQKEEENDDFENNQENVGAAQVKIPRMGANLYSYKKNQNF